MFPYREDEEYPSVVVTPTQDDRELVRDYLSKKFFSGDLSDQALREAQGEARNKELVANLAHAGATIGAAFAPGTKVDSGFYENLAKQSQSGVQDIQERRKGRMEESRFAREGQVFDRDAQKFELEKRRADPTSPESRVFRDALRKLKDHGFTEEELANISAADSENIRQMIQLKQNRDAQRENTAARLQTGQLAREEREAKKAEERKIAEETLNVPEFNRVPGIRQGKDEAEKARKALGSFNSARLGLERMKALVKEYGTYEYGGKGGKEMESLQASLIVQLKNMYELGVLNGGDLDLIQKQIQDPESWDAMFTLDGNGISGLDATKTKLEKDFNAGMAAKGYVRPSSGVGKDEEALRWAENNPDDPRAKPILNKARARLGAGNGVRP